MGHTPGEPHSRRPQFQFRLKQFYITHRTYLTPNKIKHYFHKAEAACPRCDLVDADFFHMLWGCHSLTHYCQGVTRHLSMCTERPIAHTWETCIAGLHYRDKKYRPTSWFLDLGLLIAKCLITGAGNPGTPGDRGLVALRDRLGQGGGSGVRQRRQFGTRSLQLGHYTGGPPSLSARGTGPQVPSTWPSADVREPPHTSSFTVVLWIMPSVAPHHGSGVMTVG